jgi:hypothetical protein
MRLPLAMFDDSDRGQLRTRDIHAVLLSEQRWNVVQGGHQRGRRLGGTIRVCFDSNIARRYGAHEARAERPEHFRVGYRERIARDMQAQMLAAIQRRSEALHCSGLRGDAGKRRQHLSSALFPAVRISLTVAEQLLPLVVATGTALHYGAEKEPMAHAARQEQDPLLSARQALEEGRGSDGADAVRQAVAVSGSAPTYDQALRLAVEFNLVSLARELAEAAVGRYPRDAKLKHWAKVLAPPVVREYTGPRISSIERDKDIAWLREHADEYRGMWVVLSGGELLAAGKRDIRRALRRIRRRTSAPLFIHSLRE